MYTLILNTMYKTESKFVEMRYRIYQATRFNSQKVKYKRGRFGSSIISTTNIPSPSFNNRKSRNSHLCLTTKEISVDMNNLNKDKLRYWFLKYSTINVQYIYFYVEIRQASTSNTSQFNFPLYFCVHISRFHLLFSISRLIRLIILPFQGQYFPYMKWNF